MSMRAKWWVGSLVAALLISVLIGCGAATTPPVEVFQRDSLLGIGTILIVSNPSETALESLEFRFENPNGDVKNYALDRLGAGEEIEIGWKKHRWLRSLEPSQGRGRCSRLRSLAGS